MRSSLNSDFFSVPRPRIFGHRGIIHRVGPGRGAVIAQIERDDAVPRGEVLCDRGPVAPRAEQPVQNRQRRSRAIFGGGQRNGHMAPRIVLYALI